MTKLIKAFCVLLPVIILVIWWFTTGGTIVLYHKLDYYIHLELPRHLIESILIDYECTITMFLPHFSGRFRLLYNVFDHPKFLWFSEEKQALYLVYQRDTEDAFLVIEPKQKAAREMSTSSQLCSQIKELESKSLETSHSQENLDNLRVEEYRSWQLERIVRHIDHNALQVRYFASHEFDVLIHIIEELSETEFQSHTLPLKILHFKEYPSAGGLINQLKYFQQSQRHFSDKLLIMGK